MTTYQMQSYQNNSINRQNAKGQQFTNFGELKEKLMDQIELMPQDFHPLKQKISSQLMQCDQYIKKLNNIHGTIINEGIKEFKNHMQSVLTFQGESLKNDQSFNLEQMRNSIKEGLLEMSDLMHQVLNFELRCMEKKVRYKLKILANLQWQFLIIKISQKLIKIYDYLRMNESQLAQKCSIPLKAFNNDLSKDDINQIRKYYFEQIYLNEDSYLKQINNNSSLLFFQSKSQIQTLIIKLHNIIVDKLNDVCQNVDNNRLFIQIMHRDSQKYLVLFQKQASLIINDIKDKNKRELSNQFLQLKNKRIESNHQKFNQIQRMKLNFIQNIQQNKEGYDQLLQIDDQINKFIKEYEDLKKQSDSLEKLSDDLKFELDNIIEQFQQQLSQKFQDQKEANIEKDIQTLLDELQQNLEDELNGENQKTVFQQKLQQCTSPFLKQTQSFKSNYKIGPKINTHHQFTYTSETMEHQRSRIEKEQEWQQQRMDEQQQQQELKQFKDQQKEEALAQIRQQRQQDLNTYLTSINVQKGKDDDSEKIENESMMENKIKRQLQMEEQRQRNKELQEEQQRKKEEQMRQQKQKLEDQRRQQEHEKQLQKEKLEFQRQQQERERQEKQERLRQQQQQEMDKKRQQEQERQEKIRQQQEQDNQKKKQMEYERQQKQEQLKQQQQQENEKKRQQEQERQEKLRQQQQQEMDKKRQQEQERQEKMRIQQEQDNQKKQQMERERQEKMRIQQEQDNIKKQQMERERQEKMRIQQEQDNIKKQQQQQQQQELNQKQEIEKQKKQREKIQQDESIKFDKKLNEIKTFRQNQQQNFYSKLNKSQLDQATLFEKYINQIKQHRQQEEQNQNQQLQKQQEQQKAALLKQEQEKKSQFQQQLQKKQDTECQIFVKKLDEIQSYRMNLMKKEQQEHEMKLQGISQKQVQQCQIFEKKLNEIIKYRKDKDDQFNKEIKDLENQRQQEELKKQKEQQDKLDQIRNKKLKIDQDQIDQSKIFEQKLQIIQKYRDDKDKEFNDQIKKEEENKKKQQDYENQLNQKKQRELEQRNHFQLEQAEIFEEYLMHIEDHRENMRIDDEQDQLRQLKSQQQNNYGDDSDPELEYPDEDIQFEDDYSLSPTKIEKKPIKLEESEDYLKNSKHLYQGQSDSEEYKQDFEDPTKMQNEEDEGVPLPLIQFQDIQNISELIKQCVGQQGPPSFEEFNNFQYLIELMSEYLNQKAIFFDFDHGDMLLDLTEQFLEESEKSGQEEALEALHDQLCQFQEILIKQYFEENYFAIFYLSLKTNQELILLSFVHSSKKCFSFMIPLMFLMNSCKIYNYQPNTCEMPGRDPDEMIDYEVTLIDQSQNEIYKSQLPYIQYIMVCFGLVYEQDIVSFCYNDKILQLNNELLRRLFNVLISRINVQSMLNEEEYQELYQKQFIGYVNYAEQEQNHVVLQVTIPASSEDLEQEIYQEVGTLMERTQHIGSGFLLVEIEQEQQKMTYYMNAFKISDDKYELSLYIYEIYDEKFNALVAETVFACQQQFPEYEVKCYQDFPRQNQIYEHGLIVLGIWLRFVDQVCQNPHLVFQFINYCFIPTQMFLQEEEEEEEP